MIHMYRSYPLPFVLLVSIYSASLPLVALDCELRQPWLGQKEKGVRERDRLDLEFNFPWKKKRRKMEHTSFSSCSLRVSSGWRRWRSGDISFSCKLRGPARRTLQRD